MRFLTDFADEAVIIPLVIATAVALAMQGWRRGAIVWLAVVAATFALTLGLKLMFLACAPLADPIDIHSPSGHVAAATVVAGGLAAMLTRRRTSMLPAALLTAVAIGISRLMLGMHTLPEVVLGALIGLTGVAALVCFVGPLPRPRGRLMIAIVVVVACLFHGLHLPAEAAIRHTAFRAALHIPACQADPAPERLHPDPQGGSQGASTSQKIHQYQTFVGESALAPALPAFQRNQGVSPWPAQQPIRTT